MIWRLWFVLLIVAAAGAWALAVPFSPATSMKTESNIGAYRAEGALPAPGGLTLSRAVGHEVFELPAEDAGHLREAQAAAGGMAGMAGMEMGQGAEAGPGTPATGEHGAGGMEMAMPGGAEPEAHGGEMAGTAEMKSGHGAEPGETGPTAEGHEEAGMQMAMPGQHEAEEPGAAGGHGGGGEMAGISVLAIGSSDEVAGRLQGIAVDRSVEVAMTEWGYAPARVMVAAGEVVRLSLRNDGRLPHEFMLMTAPAMAAVNYRLERADWNLLEHEAIAEMPIVMPGDGFEIVARIHRPGSWMFMCMFPYHMRLGMMGMLMTEGADMEMAPGMKM